MVRFNLVEVCDKFEVEAAPLVAVALGLLEVTFSFSPLWPFNTGILLLFRSSMLLIAALLSCSSSSMASRAVSFFLHPFVHFKCIFSTSALENESPQYGHRSDWSLSMSARSSSLLSLASVGVPDFFVSDGFVFDLELETAVDPLFPGVDGAV